MTFSKLDQVGVKRKKSKTGLKQISDKKREAMADRSRVLKLLRDQRGNKCELKFSSNCTGKAQGLHEPLKQSASPWKVGDFERGRVVFLACNICNGAIEDEPERAKREGFSESRFGR